MIAAGQNLLRTRLPPAGS